MAGSPSESRNVPAETGPLPELEGLTGEFYAFCRQGELAFQRCTACRAWRHVPRPLCGACGSGSWRWERSGGLGTIYSLIRIHRALDPVLQQRAPFYCAVIEMDEGVRIVAEVLHEAGRAEPQIGARAAVEFVAVTEAVTLPKFRVA